MTFIDVQVGDIARLRKQHPCGGWEWEVIRTGADIGLVCTTCKRRLLMPRHKFRRAVKRLDRPQASTTSTIEDSVDLLTIPDLQDDAQPEP